MNIIWRPTKLNERTIQKLKEAFKLWCSVEEACSYAEISSSSYYEWLSKNEEFSEEISIVKKYLEFKSRAVIAQSLENWDVKTAMWYLERKSKDEFNLQHIEVKVPENRKMVIEYKRSPYENYDENWNPTK